MSAVEDRWESYGTEFRWPLHGAARWSRGLLGNSVCLRTMFGDETTMEKGERGDDPTCPVYLRRFKGIIPVKLAVDDDHREVDKMLDTGTGI